jgi:hypothetical protein
MLNRLAFASIVLFWLVMNVLLWRSEFKGQNELGSAVPVDVVWAKILSAPDDSALEISHRQKNIGYCRWRANVGQEISTGKVADEDLQPEGMIQRLSGYTVDLEGNLLLTESGNRLRFELHGGFSATHAWQAFTARASIRPRTLEIRGSAASESLNVTFTDGGAKWEQPLTFADLRDPAKLLRQIGVPPPSPLLDTWSTLLPSQNVALGLQWSARNDWLTIGHSKVRVYRLQARLLDRYQAVIIVSRVGEILRVELPNELVFINDALTSL